MLRDGSLEEKDYMMLQVNDVKEMEVNMTEEEGQKVQEGEQGFWQTNSRIQMHTRIQI